MTLGELVEYVKGLLDLGLEGVVVLEEVEEFGRIHLEEHTGDLTGEIRLSRVDLGVETTFNPNNGISFERE